MIKQKLLNVKIVVCYLRIQKSIKFLRVLKNAQMSCLLKE